MKYSAFTALALIAVGAFADPKGDDIAKAALERKSPVDTTAVATMTITDANGGVKIRKLREVSKDFTDGTTRAYVEFLEPADVNGTKFLTVSKQGADTDQRLYLPALKKVRKISSSSKDGEFVGSDLYYFDMEKRYFDDGAYTFLSSGETLDGEAFSGMTFDKISITFKDPNAPYSKGVAWINPADHIAYRTDYYGKKDGALLKTVTIEEVKTLKGYAITSRMVVVNYKKGSKTVMSLGDLIVDSGVKESDLSVKRLER